MQYFPLFLDLRAKAVLVVGGGEVASRKVEALLRADARITIVSPKLSDYLADLVREEQCEWIQSEYDEKLMTSYCQVWATTNDSALNHLVHSHAKKRQILVNVVDDKPYCDFITPAMIERGRIQVAISSGGASPVLARNIREKIEIALAQNTGLLADFAASKREHIKTAFQTVDERRYFWELFFADRRAEQADSIQELEQLYQDTIQQKQKVTASRIWVEFGQDAELLTLKSVRLMQQSELVLFPKEISQPFLDLCRRDADRVLYSCAEELVGELQKFGLSDLKRACIFIQKGTKITDYSDSDEYLNDRLFRVEA